MLPDPNYMFVTFVSGGREGGGGEVNIVMYHSYIGGYGECHHDLLTYQNTNLKRCILYQRRVQNVRRTIYDKPQG